MTREEAVALLERYSNYDGMGIPNLAGCKEAMKVAVDALKEAFPGLTESEDEKMLRTIIKGFENWKSHGNLTFNNANVDDILAYLEKQKEQKKEKFPPYVTGFKGHPDPAGTSDLEEAAKEYASKTLCDPDDGPSTGLAKESFIAGAEWQKEQKPASISRGHEIVKPAEWNDTDMKEARDNLISVCRDWERGMQTALLPIVAVRARYFLEHLTEPKPVEWSEEDEDRIRQIERIAQQAGCTQKLNVDMNIPDFITNAKSGDILATKYGSLLMVARVEITKKEVNIYYYFDWHKDDGFQMNEWLTGFYGPKYEPDDNFYRPATDGEKKFFTEQMNKFGFELSEEYGELVPRLTHKGFMKFYMDK